MSSQRCVWGRRQLNIPKQPHTPGSVSRRWVSLTMRLGSRLWSPIILSSTEPVTNQHRQKFSWREPQQQKRMATAQYRPLRPADVKTTPRECANTRGILRHAESEDRLAAARKRRSEGRGKQGADTASHTQKCLAPQHRWRSTLSAHGGQLVVVLLPSKVG